MPLVREFGGCKIAPWRALRFEFTFTARSEKIALVLAGNMAVNGDIKLVTLRKIKIIYEKPDVSVGK